MKNELTLETERLILKTLGKEHISIEYVNWMNDSNVYKYLESGGDYSLEKLESFIHEVEKKNIFFWAIHIKESGNHIGNIKIDPVNSRHGLGEYGILMGDCKEWGKGYAKEASSVVIDFCFNALKLRKITLGVIEDNRTAFLMYEKLGFKVEGIYKDHGFYDSKYCNCIRMALFNPNNFSL